MLRTLVALSLIAVPFTAASAQARHDGNRRTAAEAEAAATPIPEVASSNTLPQRVRSVTVVGAEKCPKSSGDEIVVCSRIGEGDQYRIPTQLRRGPPKAANNSWANRAQVIDDVGRTAAGLPDTCSVVGSGGQTGCSAQILQQYGQDKRAKQREQDSIP